MANGWGGKRRKSGPKRPKRKSRRTNWGGARSNSGPPRKTKIVEKGWCIYVVHEAESLEICKIGMTGKSLPVRLSGLQIGNWRSLVVAAVVQVDSEAAMIDLEARVHHKLHAQRISGEWFKISSQAALALIGETMLEVGIARANPQQKAMFDD